MEESWHRVVASDLVGCIIRKLLVNGLESEEVREGV